jgi:hypothetical protein
LFNAMKTFDATVYPSMKSKLKRLYEDKLNDVTFIMFVPIILLVVLIVSLMIGRVKVTYNDIMAMVINILLLVSTFLFTFVNLGMKNTEDINIIDVANTYKPKENHHRFPLEYTFTESPVFYGSFMFLMVFCTTIGVMVVKLRSQLIYNN